MQFSIPGVVLAICIYVMNFVIFPFYVIGCHSYIQSYHSMLNETRDFVDEVIDTREITDTMIEDFNYALSSHDVVYTAQIFRKVKTINPDPVHPGQTITSYTIVDDYKTFNTGDRITVICEPITVGPYQSITRMLLHLPLDEQKIQKTARVR